MEKLANHLTKHTLQRHLLFLGMAIFAAWLNGYHYGTFDQVFHITFLKKFIDPNLYFNDPFLTLRWYHFSFFWFPFIPLYKAGILQISMFVIHILTIYGTIWSFWAISDLLFKNDIANLLLAVAIVFPHFGLPGFQIIEFSLLNRTFVLPFLLGSIWLYLKNKKCLAFGLLGILFNLHVIYASFVFSMFILNEVLTFSWKHWWKPFLFFSIFLLTGLPVILWRMHTGSGIDLSLRPEMLDLASRGLLYTVYYPIGPFSHTIFNFLAGIGTVWSFILGYRVAPRSEIHQKMRNFALAIAIIVLISIIVNYLLPITILVQMQILRAGIFMLYFGMIYLSYFICDQWKKKNLNNQGFILLGISFIFLITPLITIIFWYLSKLFKKTKVNPLWMLTIIAAIQALTLSTALQSKLWQPGFYINGPVSEWRDVQEWAKINTPIDTKFISPPHMFGHYTPDWRVFSERASVVTLPEMMEIPFDPEFSENFRQRFEAVAQGAIDSFDGNYMRSINITENAFYTNSAANFIDIGCQFSANFLVVEQTHPYTFEVVYENNQFILYKLPECP